MRFKLYENFWIHICVFNFDIYIQIRPKNFWFLSLSYTFEYIYNFQYIKRYKYKKTLKRIVFAFDALDWVTERIRVPFTLWITITIVCFYVKNTEA